MGLNRLLSGDLAVCFHGRLDSTTAAEVRELLHEIEALPGRDVVVVATEMDAIDREGVGVLVASLRRLRLQNRDLYVTMPSATVLRALRRMNLHRVLLVGGRVPMDWLDPCFDPPQT